MLRDYRLIHQRRTEKSLHSGQFFKRTIFYFHFLIDYLFLFFIQQQRKIFSKFVLFYIFIYLICKESKFNKYLKKRKEK